MRLPVKVKELKNKTYVVSAWFPGEDGKFYVDNNTYIEQESLLDLINRNPEMAKFDGKKILFYHQIKKEDAEKIVQHPGYYSMECKYLPEEE